ncbi:hypothetical protein BC828DRAFT_382929 [Blastocladiella britannica]|nr:hypothetical protein BC828DRAFT_382929 [Blastocladiella britannica]
MQQHSAADRALPRKIEKLVPDSAFYARLLDSERRIDALLMRKRLEIQATLAKPLRAHGTLRLYISNYAADQPSSSASAAAVPPSSPTSQQQQQTRVPNWTLRIEGRLLDSSLHPTTYVSSTSGHTRTSAGGALPSGTPTSAHPTPAHRFSHFVKQIAVELDRDPAQYRDSNIAEYTRLSATTAAAGTAGAAADFDGFEVKRAGDKDVKAKITLRFDCAPEKFKMSPELARILGFDPTGSKFAPSQLVSKADVVVGVWDYIKANNLLDQSDKRLVNCDAALKQLLGNDVVDFPNVPDLVTRHLYPPDPIVLHYTIRVDQEYTTAHYVYDVEVEWDDLPAKAQLHALASGSEHAREISDLDAQISAAIVALNNHRLKRDFMLSFARDPVVFLTKYLDSQARDMSTLMAGNMVSRSDARSAEFFQQEWMKDAVGKYLLARGGRA